VKSKSVLEKNKRSKPGKIGMGENLPISIAMANDIGIG